MKSDIEIARSTKAYPIPEIANKLGLNESEYDMYGKGKAKVDIFSDSYRNKNKKSGKLILVTAISPTPAGEGKTTVSIGLADGMNAIGENTTAVLREPSLGPVFGIKGGAAGGGYSQVIPMEDINLHFTGDFGAIESANNLLAALIDNNIQAKNPDRRIDPRTVSFKRVLDMNDRALRNMVIGLGGGPGGIARESGFYITAASEVMAILCLSRDLRDLKERLGNIYCGNDFEGKPVYAKDLKAENAMALLLKEALKPNLVQTLEGTPAILHGGPFANIAQGTNSVIATKTGLELSDYVVTEAGFGADLGAEKFLNIKCRAADLNPSVIVIVATARALKHHGGVSKDELNIENLDALSKGMDNLERHIENMQSFGPNVVVAINRFPSDTGAELKSIQKFCQKLNVRCEVSDGFAKGGNGTKELARSVVEAVKSSKHNELKYTYGLSDSVQNKIEQIAKKIYKADGVEFSSKAIRDIKTIESLGQSELPICMAKTQYSFTDDPKKINAPSGFKINIREVELATGAGFIIPILGAMLRMPGLPSVPAAEGMVIDEKGIITGLS
ncbi:MAG: formate--tetrahydrofolate ligase [Candidatus Kapaibacteriales bacterium]